MMTNLLEQMRAGDQGILGRYEGADTIEYTEAQDEKEAMPCGRM